MNIIQPYAHIIRIGTESIVSLKEAGVDALRWIEWCGRISHRSEDAQTDNSWIRFIKAVVLDHGDWSIVEHATATVDMLVDRGITHEVVRHRLFSYTQESTRFVNYEKKMPASFIEPPLEPAQSMTDDLSLNDKRAAAKSAWEVGIKGAETSYRELIRLGIAPQIARSVFPNALASRIIITGNLRSWRHFLIMRTTKEAHPQMRQVTIPLLKEFQSLIPILYDDLVPEARQIDNLRLPG